MPPSGTEIDSLFRDYTIKIQLCVHASFPALELPSEAPAQVPHTRHRLTLEPTSMSLQHAGVDVHTGWQFILIPYVT